MNTHPEMSDEEIAGAMDFAQILRLVELTNAQRLKTTQRIVYGTLAIAFLSIGYVIYDHVSSAPNHDKAASTNQPIIKRDLQTIVEPNDTVMHAPQKEIKKTKTSISPAPSKRLPTDITVVRPEYIPAEPVAGFPALYEYLNTSLRYPETGIKDSLSGVVTVQFVISEDGSPGSISVLQSLGEAYDKEAIRLIQHMPAWKPARLGEEPVSSKMTIPITFSISNSK